MTRDIVPILLRIPRREIAYVKFIFESYEGVAVARTIDRKAATIVILVAPDFLDQARIIVESFQRDGICQELPLPAEADVDWLDDDQTDVGS